jgi:S-adenosylmethionine/arginine decarboxylase-like enzyme
MEACKLCFWDYKGEPEEYAQAPAHLKGTSAIQFISTSNITIHTLDEMKRVYLNIFTCKDFDPDIVIIFCLDYFEGELIKDTMIERI